MKNLIVIRPPDSMRSVPAYPPPLGLDSLPKGTEVWLINDGRSFFPPNLAEQMSAANSNTNLRIISNNFRYGWGGVQKVALQYAVEHGYDTVLLLGLWNAAIQPLIDQLLNVLHHQPGKDAILIQQSGFHRRLMEWILRFVSGTKIKGPYSAVKAYRTSALKKVAFELNTFEDHFDTEILLQLGDAGSTIEFIKTKAPVQARRLTLLRLINDLKAATKFRLQKFGFFYDVRFHPELWKKGISNHIQTKTYESKFEDLSPHSLVQREDALVPPGSRVLDIGCSTGYVSSYLSKVKKCDVVGVDILSPTDVHHPEFKYVQINLENEAEKVANLIEQGEFDVVLMLDVLEHLSNPESFLLALFKRKYKRPPRFLFSTGNVAFIGVRGMLLLGYFNYGERGILDITHKRLFSYRTFKNLIEQTGYRISRRFFFPLPFKKLRILSGFSSFLESLNILLIKVFPTLFSYQIMFEAEILSPPQPLQERIPVHEKK